MSTSLMYAGWLATFPRPNWSLLDSSLHSKPAPQSQGPQGAVEVCNIYPRSNLAVKIPDLKLVKASHSALLHAYASVLQGDENEKRGFWVRAFIESHVKFKLKELSKCYIILNMGLGTSQSEDSAWYRETSNACDSASEKLRSMSTFLVVPWRIFLLLSSLILTLILAKAYEKVIAPIEAFSNLGPLLKLLNEQIIPIVLFSFVLVMLSSLLLVPFVDNQFNRKRRLLGHPSQIDGDTPDNPNQNIYELENILFNQIGFLKVPEFPLDVVLGVIFTTLFVPSFAYVFYIIMPSNRAAISILATLMWLSIVLYRFNTWKTRLS